MSENIPEDEQAAAAEDISRIAGWLHADPAYIAGLLGYELSEG